MNYRFLGSDTLYRGNTATAVVIPPPPVSEWISMIAESNWGRAENGQGTWQPNGSILSGDYPEVWLTNVYEGQQVPADSWYDYVFDKVRVTFAPDNDSYTFDLQIDSGTNIINRVPSGTPTGYRSLQEITIPTADSLIPAINLINQPITLFDLYSIAQNPAFTVTDIEFHQVGKRQWFDVTDRNLYNLVSTNAIWDGTQYVLSPVDSYLFIKGVGAEWQSVVKVEITGTDDWELKENVYVMSQITDVTGVSTNATPNPVGYNAWDFQNQGTIDDRSTSWYTSPDFIHTPYHQNGWFFGGLEFWNKHPTKTLYITKIRVFCLEQPVIPN